MKIPNKKLLKLKIDTGIFDQLENYCKTNDLEKAKILEQLIKDFLKVYDKKPDDGLLRLL